MDPMWRNSGNPSSSAGGGSSSPLEAKVSFIRLGVSNRFGTVLVVAMTKLIDLIDLIATSTNELLYWMTIG